ncbi:hypothetical protein [Rhizobium leguminosarum]|uniref:hypothetical protein n=1 Tax=Rhizobium leguminosarum TaxID=384 RepID=UPI003F96AF82
MVDRSTRAKASFFFWTLDAGQDSGAVLKEESFAGSISEAKHSHKNRNQTGVYEPATNRIIADF